MKPFSPRAGRCLRWSLPAGITLLAVAAMPAAAQVYKCQSPQRGVEYRSIPCDWSASQRVVQPAQAGSERAQFQAVAARAGEPDDPQRQTEARLQRSCAELQARVNAAQRYIAGIERSLRDAASRAGATPNANDSAEIAQALQKERYRISSAQRQAEADRCERVGIVVGSALAGAVIEERDCRALRDELAHWESGRGKSAADAALRALATQDQLFTRGCKAG